MIFWSRNWSCIAKLYIFTKKQDILRFAFAKVMIESWVVFVMVLLWPSQNFAHRCIFISFFSNGTAEETEFLNSDHVKKLENELETLMKKPGYFGLTESIEWVLKVARDSSNTFEDCDNFLSYVVCDNLFTEKYHNLT